MAEATEKVPSISDFQRGPGGKFVSTPGRLPGTKNRTAQITLAEIRAMGGDAVNALRDAVSAGERWAVEYVLSKIVPAGRTVELEEVTPTNVIGALKAGEISSDEARDIATALVRLAEIDAIKDLEQRLAALEANADER